MGHSEKRDDSTAASVEERAGGGGERISSSQDDSTGFTEADWTLDKQVVRRLDWTVLPLVGLIYFLSFLDRSNIGNARVAGLQKDLGLSSHQYLIVITATYVVYIAVELPSNLLLKVIGPHILIPSLVGLWGITTTLTGLVQNYGGLVAARAVLGGLEGGVFPGLVLYLSLFYRRKELQTRISLFFSAASLSGAFSGLLAAGFVSGMKGLTKLEAWRYIFIYEGIITVVVAVVCFFLLPRTPQHSLFLNDAQKAHVTRRLALDAPPGAGPEADKFSWRELKMAFTSVHVWLLFIALFGNGVTVYGNAYFTPTIVQTFGFSPVQTQLLTVPPFVCAFIVTMVNAYLSDKYGQRGICAIGASLLAVIGYSMFLGSEDKWIRFGSLFFSITGAYSTAPALVTWLPNLTAPHYRRATAVAMGFIATNSGGILSTWLFPSNEGPNYHRATIVNIVMACVAGLFSFINILYLVRQNRDKERRKAGATADTWHLEGDRHPFYRYIY